MKAYIGIDPGQSGGIAVITDAGSPFAWKMPDTERDIWDVIETVRRWKDCEVSAMIESVHSMPGQGVSSSFTFGKGYGGLRMALIAARIPFTEVTPQKWQKGMECLTRGNKNVSKRKAQQLFPTMKITHANADALLIAEWHRRTSK